MRESAATPWATELVAPGATCRNHVRPPSADRKRSRSAGRNATMRAGIPGKWKTSTGPDLVSLNSSTAVKVRPPSVERNRSPLPDAHTRFGSIGSTSRSLPPDASVGIRPRGSQLCPPSVLA